MAVEPKPKEDPTPPEDDPAARPADDPEPTPAEKTKAPTRLVEYYSDGTAGTWTLLRDSRGQTIAGLGSDLSSDSLELVVRRTSPEGLFIARRASIEKPFDGAKRQPLVGSEGTFFFSPSFARGERELRFLNWEQGQDDAPKPVMSSARADRRNDFLKASPILGLSPGVHGHGGTRWSANDTYTVVYKKIDEPPWLVQRKGRSYDAGQTNLPARKIGSHSDIAPVTVRGDGSVLYTQDINGGIWLYGARRRAGTTFYDTPARLLDLKYPPGHTHHLSLSRDARVIIHGHDDQLMYVMRVPEDSRREIISFLGPPYGEEVGRTGDATTQAIDADARPRRRYSVVRRDNSDGRTRWVHDTGEFAMVLASEGVWEEKSPNGRIYRYRETGRTKEFVQLDAVTGDTSLRFRLYDDHCDNGKKSDGNLRPLFLGGRWVN